MKIYLSGSISKDPNYVAHFGHYEAELKNHGEIVNPTNHWPFLGREIWICYMVTSIRRLIFCDSIYMLPGWERSKGARTERFVAKLAGIDAFRVNRQPLPEDESYVKDCGSCWYVVYTTNKGSRVWELIPKHEKEKPLWMWRLIRRITKK